MDDPCHTMREVALLVAYDPGLAARFLRIVNSPLLRRAKKIETVAHAMSMLDSRQIHDIVLGASIATAFDGIGCEVVNMRQFWRRSVYCAVTAQQLAVECQEMPNERLFLIGLLHDIGHMFMYLGIPQKAQKAILLARKQDCPLFKVERTLFGFDYAKLAVLMMKDWHFPDSLLIPIEFHPAPGIVNQFKLETALIHIANRLVQADLEDGVFGEGAFVVDPEAWQMTGLTEANCLQAQQTAAENFDEVAKSIFS